MHLTALSRMSIYAIVEGAFMTMILRQTLRAFYLRPALLVAAGCLFLNCVHASYGDRLPEFQRCVQVCKVENCGDGEPAIPLLYKLLLWNCESECDYTCQHIITDRRIVSGEAVVQFHGKWPFYRFAGMQEPFSVLCSLLNFLAHYDGLSKILKHIPSSYTLRTYYVWLAYFGMMSWLFSMIFHTRDFTVTEQLDYFAAGASVLYGLYYTTIRIFRLDQGGQKTKSLARFWTLLCVGMYAGHVTYLKMYSWNYSYNMTANVVIGIIQNFMWSCFSVDKYRRLQRSWAAWPGLVVAWVLVAMSLELLDFPPVWGIFDAHSLWHLGTVAPTWLWYNFLLKDAQEDIAARRLKA